MRIFGLLSSLLAVVASIGLLAWWLGTGGMRLAVRGLERFPPLREGALAACGALLAALFIVIAGGVSLLAALLFQALSPVLDQGTSWPSWLLRAWQLLLSGTALLLAAAGIIAALLEALAAWAATRRCRRLLRAAPDAEPASPAPGGEGGRRIVILCDGTGNRPDQQEDGIPATTNVRKLYATLRQDEGQVPWYQAGVGSDTSSTAQDARLTQRVLDLVGAKTGAWVASIGSRLLKLGEAAFGSGISEGIVDGYAEIVRQYRPGDRIYLIGFSRGAYTARCIAGVISRCGLLRAENLRYAPEVVRLYRTRSDPDQSLALRPDMVHAEAAVEFLGAFDTVASLGAPLWGWWFRTLPIWKNASFATDPAPSCRHVYHALSMDERRSQFFPTLFSRPGSGAHRLVTLEQRWFRGAHADIGGGYAAAGLSDITLGWMMDAMERHGLRFAADARAALRPDPLARLHDELQRKPYWKLFGSWPRWHPVPDGIGRDPWDPRLHRSVLRRAVVSQTRLNRPDLRRLAPGEAAEFAVEAQRDWDRSGFIIETGALYELTWLGGRWRDAEQRSAGPMGQGARGLLDARRYFGWGRRCPQEPWLQLVGTVAHPRVWDPQERGLAALLRLLFVNSPPELNRQLAGFGRSLTEPGQKLLVTSSAPAGLLYLFANDWWQTANNNSGAIRMRIRHLAAPEDGVPLWRLRDDGGWDAP